MVASSRTFSTWQRYAWVAGIVFVIVFVAETVVSVGVGVSQNDSAVKIANALADHRERLLVIAYLSVVYAAMFLIYLGGLYDHCSPPERTGIGTPSAATDPSATDPNLTSAHTRGRGAEAPPGRSPGW